MTVPPTDNFDYHKYITIEPGKRSGQPCIRGMRITVLDLLEYLVGGNTVEQLLEDPGASSRRLPGDVSKSSRSGA